jgi:pimeloyl-ACP methyl ester carboxylesterase
VHLLESNEDRMLLQKSKSAILLLIVLVFSIILAACSGTSTTPPSTSGTSPTTQSTTNTSSLQSQQSANRHKLFVFVSGFTSSLSQLDVTSNNGYGSDPDFFRKDHIQPFLLNKFPGSYFLVYSYHGFSTDGKPLPYTCALSTDSDIGDLAVGLRNQITQFLRSHPNTDVYVIGHSLGGVIAFSFLAQMIEGNNNLLNSLPNGGVVKGIFTLDSPIGGVTQDLFYTQVAARSAVLISAILIKPNCISANLLTLPVVGELNDLFKSATAPEFKGATASVDATITQLNQKKNQDVARDAMQNGVKVATFGNSSDVLWQPGLCYNPMSNFLNTQWLNEVQSGTNQQGGAVYARTFSEGTLSCNTLLNANNPGNHFSVLTNQSVQTAIWQVITGSAPDALKTLSRPTSPTPVLSPTPSPPLTPTDTPTPTPIDTLTPTDTPTPVPDPIVSKTYSGQVVSNNGTATVTMTFTMVAQDQTGATTIQGNFSVASQLSNYSGPFSGTINNGTIQFTVTPSDGSTPVVYTGTPYEGTSTWEGQYDVNGISYGTWQIYPSS